MYVTGLQLRDFRSWPSVALSLDAGVSVLWGRNGQGKTNLVEAVDYLATLGSHRVSSDVPLIRAGCESAVVKAVVRAGAADDRSVVLDVEIARSRANRARLNRGDLPRPRDLLGVLRTVVFSPEDLAIVKGDPASRRRFIDDLLVQRWPRMAGVRSDWERALRQRSVLLKQLAATRRVDADALATLEVWDQHLVSFGSELMAARRDTLTAMAGPLETIHAAIADSPRAAGAVYTSAVSGGNPEELREGFLSALAQRRDEELRRGVTLVGPHRDDIDLSIGDLPAKGYASHGESWSLALSLRLAALAVLRRDGVEPVLILDDVFAELDAERRSALAAHALTAEQVLVTAAVADDVPSNLGGARFRVDAGEVCRE